MTDNIINPLYNKFIKCMILRKIDCGSHNNMCNNEALKICMTKHPYNTKFENYNNINNTETENKIINKTTKNLTIENMNNLTNDNDNDNMIDYFETNLSFLWFFIIEPNILQIIFLSIFIVVITQFQL